MARRAACSTRTTSPAARSPARRSRWRAGLVAFALGTDTAGSGRVPAAFNNIVGLKPTPGLVSSTGVVPACRSLDCVTVFAASVADGVAVRRVIEGFDADDAYSIAPAPTALVGPAARRRADGKRPRILRRCRQRRAVRGRHRARQIARLGDRRGRLRAVPRYRRAALRRPVGRRTLGRDRTVSGRQAGGDRSDRARPDRSRAALHRRGCVQRPVSAQKLLRVAAREADKFDVLLLPTSPTIYTVEAMLADPVRLNAQFGRYTNFVNLGGMSAIAVPAGFRADGLPFGVTLIAPSQCDDALAPFAAAFHDASGCGAGLYKEKVTAALPAMPSGDQLEIAVVGAHLSGQPLNGQLTQAGGQLLETTRTAADYRLFVLPDTTPAKPGLIREPGFAGPGIELEVWSLPAAAFGAFVAAIPAPLGVGKITLADGRAVTGFLVRIPRARRARGRSQVSAAGGTISLATISRRRRRRFRRRKLEISDIDRLHGLAVVEFHAPAARRPVADDRSLPRGRSADVAGVPIRSSPHGHRARETTRRARRASVHRRLGDGRRQVILTVGTSPSQHRSLRF